MALLNRGIVKEIESHFYNYEAERRFIEERTAEIAERADFSHKLAAPANAAPEDSTHKSAVYIENELGRLKKWVNVVKATAEKFKDTPHMRLIMMIYAEGKSEARVCDTLYIERRTYYSWKGQIIQYAAMKACEEGLISV